MQQDNVSVTLTVGAAPWQKTLASSLLQAGMLRRILSSSPYLEIHDPNRDESLEVSKRFPLNRGVKLLAWGIWRRLRKRWRPAIVVRDTGEVIDPGDQIIDPDRVRFLILGELAESEKGLRKGPVQLKFK